jgi:hypothetical protein
MADIAALAVVQKLQSAPYQDLDHRDIGNQNIDNRGLAK